MGHATPTKTSDHQLVSLANLLQLFRSLEDTDKLIQATVKHLADEFQYRLVWIALYDRINHQLVGKGGILPSGDSSFLTETFSLVPGDLLEQIVIQQRPIGVPDLKQENRAGEWQLIAQQFDIQGTLLFPLRNKNICLGVALLGSHLWGISPREADKAHLSMLLGGLGEAIHQAELERQRQSAKHPEMALFQVLEQTHGKPSLQLRLENIVTHTQQFIQPSRTNIYWYSPEKRCFWQRIGSHYKEGSPITLMISEIPDFYRLLSEGQTITIGTGRSPLKGEMTEQLMGRLKCRSTLAVPIFMELQLVGFVSVEDQTARIWEEVDKKFLCAVAQIVTLSSGSDETNRPTDNNEEIELKLTQQMMTVLNSHDPLPQRLQTSSKQILNHLRIDDILIFREDPSIRERELADQLTATSTVLQHKPPYELVYHYLQNRSTLQPLSTIGEKDWTRKGESLPFIMVESIADHKRWSLWAEPLKTLNIESFLLFRCISSQYTYIIIFAHHQARTWKASDLEISQLSAQLWSQSLREEQFGQQQKQLHHQYTLLSVGLEQLSQRLQSSGEITGDVLEFFAHFVNIPLVIALTWSSEESPIQVTIPNNQPLTLPSEFDRNLLKDPIIKQTINHQGWYHLTNSQIPPITQKWLLKSQPNLTLEHLWTIRLETKGNSPSHKIQVQGVLFFLNPDRQLGPSYHWDVLELLIRQWMLQSSGRSQSDQQLLKNTPNNKDNNIVESLSSESQLLNWYKHLCLEILHQSVSGSLVELSNQDNSIGSQNDRPHPSDKTLSLRHMKQDKMLKQLESTTNILTPLLQEEKLHLLHRLSCFPITGLLKRSLQLMEAVYKKRNLWIRIHSQDKVSIYSDPLKLECILFELLLYACNRIPAGSRIEIQYRSIHNNTGVPQLELSILENSSSRSQQKNDPLSNKPYWEQVYAPIKASNPSLLLSQQMLKQLKGDLQFHRMANGCYLTLLTLPTTEEKIP